MKDWPVTVCEHSPFWEQVLEVDHLHNDINVVLSRRAQVVLCVAFTLELEHHVFYGQALSTDAAEFVPKAMGHAFQCIFDERLALETHKIKFSSVA